MHSTLEPTPTQVAQNLPLFQFEQRGQSAVISIDTGHTLGEGRTWRAFAIVKCENVFNARLTVESLRRRISEVVSQARRAAYNAGYRDALRGRARASHFSGNL